MKEGENDRKKKMEGRMVEKMMWWKRSCSDDGWSL